MPRPKSEVAERIARILELGIESVLLPLGFVTFRSPNPLARGWILRAGEIVWSVDAQRDKRNTKSLGRFTVNIGVGVSGYDTLVDPSHEDPGDIIEHRRLGMMATGQDVWWTVQKSSWLAFNPPFRCVRADAQIARTIQTMLQTSFLPDLERVRSAADLAVELASENGTMFARETRPPFRRAYTAAVAWHLAGNADQRDRLLEIASQAVPESRHSSREYLDEIKARLRSSPLGQSPPPTPAPPHPRIQS
jgi:hypothetical protein